MVYDDAMKSSIFNVMTWDAENRMATVAGSTYIYDAEGDRVEKQGVGVTDTIYFDGRPLARYAAGQWTNLIYGPTGLLAEVPGTQTGAPVYRVTDHLGTTAGNLTASGNFINPSDYTPFGQLFTGGTNDPYIFTGKERDTESGLDYFGARYYASNMGRFMSADWADKPEAVPYSSLSDPQTLNLYGYMRNNPLGGTDKDGHCGQQQSGGTTCPTVTVTATPATQPAPVHTTTVTDTQGNQHTVTGPNADIHFTVSTNGTPAAGVKVTETNQSTTQAGTQTINGKPIEGSATSNASGGYKDTVGAGLPSSTTTPAAAASAYNSTPVTITDTQTQTLTLPGGCTCTATSTRVVTNTTDGKTISPGGYTLTTTQPVVSTPKPPQQPQ
jgi:RHS repeat-associated protein